MKSAQGVGRTAERSVKSLVEPLITAAEAYPELERRAAAAKSSISLSFRVFDTRTKLRTAEAIALAPGDDWAALLAALASRGVKVRLQISDFDPIGGAELHRETWASLRHLAAKVANIERARGRIEAMAARHEAELGRFWRMVFTRRARRELKDVVERSADPKADYPGLRDVLSGATPRFFPATHHQKLAVVDGDFALIGGLDFDERRWDDPEHDRPAEQTWRDVSLAVRGRYARLVEHEASLIWNECMSAWSRRTEDRASLAGLADPTHWRAPADAPPSSLAVVTTKSKPKTGLFAFAPQTTSRDTEQTVLTLISDAKRFIYVETQFFRCGVIAKALADAARLNSELELVLVLPFAPERYAFHKRRDTAMRHGEALQLDAVRRVVEAFGDRAVILSPAKPSRPADEDTFLAFGAGVVYVHSKVLIADEATALVGSANLNGRSLRWDTEASFLWRDAAEVRRFQARLAESWFGPKGQGLRCAADWRDAANMNADVTPTERTGFLLPHDTRRSEGFAKRAFWLPDDLF